MDSFPMVDAHVHFWDPTTQNYPWLCEKPLIPFRYGDYSAICRKYYPDDYKKDAKGHQVVKTVYIEAEWDPTDPIGEMEFIAEMRKQTGWPNVAVGQAWMDQPNVAEVLARLAAFPFVRGVRHKPQGSKTPGTSVQSTMMDPVWRKGFAHLKPNGLRFDLQTHWWHLDDAADLARAFPDTQIILLHSGLPADRSENGITGWKAAMRAFSKCPNVAVKISGIGLPGIPWTVDNNRDIVLSIIDFFGVDRCMFGSNFPVDSVCGDLDTIFSGYKTITSGFSLEERTKLFHDNAIRFYAID
ncbi:amidohydrolase family protein [Xanthobacter sp. VNH20]|uniref:amidohydrolase family protein n=1 Tax=Xanthobacter sp. VNH20 TaxID=3156616 RepID=UPI0032B52435